jgi:hypothetical protein
MGTHITKSELLHSAPDVTQQLFGDWFDPIEMRVRERVRGFIEELIEAELEEALRPGMRRRGRRPRRIRSSRRPCGGRRRVTRPLATECSADLCTTSRIGSGLARRANTGNALSDTPENLRSGRLSRIYVC